MCVMLIQCFGCENLGLHRGARTGRAEFPVPLDAQLALVVEFVATALDELKIRASAASEQAAVVAGMEDHITAMVLRDSTRDELNVAREQYRQIRRRDDNFGVSARLHLRLCLCMNLRVCSCICAACICVGASVCNACIDQCNDIHNAIACTPRS